MGQDGAIAGDGSSRKIRNGVGARAAHTALFVISGTPVSFGRLVRLFRDELRCHDALFLDRVVSSAWLPSAQHRDSGHELGPMVVVLDRRRAPESFAQRVLRERRCRTVLASAILCVR
jgi:uncharacterized protein YigE (DUF2233 family)